MKTFLRTIITLGISVILSFTGNGQVMELPISIDFEQFEGTNISEAYPGWVEGSGFREPSLGSGKWFKGGILYSTTTASINISMKGETDGWIISPEFVVSENTHVFFNAAISDAYDIPLEGLFANDDEFAIYVSEDGGATFSKVMDMTSDLEYSFKQFNSNLAQFKGETIRVGFFVSSGTTLNSHATIHLDDIIIKDIKTHDLAINRFMNANYIEQGEDYIFNIDVTNMGKTSISYIPLRLDVRGPENRTETIFVDRQMAFAESQLIHVTDLNLTKPGIYSISVTAILENDEDDSNDRYTETFELKKNMELPLEVLDFKNTYGEINVYDGWKEAIGFSEKMTYINSLWTSGTYADHAAYSASYAGNGTFDWIVSPSFKVDENTCLYLESAIKLEDGSTGMGSDDRLIVYVSDDGGLSWSEVGDINSDNASQNWESYYFDLSSYKGRVIKVGLYATTGQISDREEFSLFIDNVKLGNILDKDIKVVGVIEPKHPATFSADEKIAVKVINLGKEPINSFTLSYAIDEGAFVDEEVKETIQPEDEFIYYFSQTADLSGKGGKHNISVKAFCDGDQDDSNNELSDVLNIYSYDPLTDGKYIQSFELDDDFSSWVVIDGNKDGAKWELHNDENGYKYDGDYTFYYSSRNITSASDEWLISNGFYLKAGKEYRISFFFANRAGSYPEKIKLTIGQEQSVAAQSRVLIDLGEITNNSFLKAAKNFTVEEDGFYYFGWNDYAEESRYAVLIDKIQVEEKVDYDIAVTRLLLPQHMDLKNNSLDSIRTAIVDLENQGEEIMSKIPISLSFSNKEESETIDFMVDQVLNPGEKITVTLADENMAFDYTKPITVQAYVNSSIDQYRRNDTIMMSNYIHENFATSFENADETADWFAVDVDENSYTWERLDSRFARTGRYCYSVNSRSSLKKNIDWLINNGFYFEAGSCYRLKFWYKNVYSKENLKLYMGKTYDPEQMNTKLFEVNIDDLQLDSYQEADIYLNVEESGIYYLGFLTDREVDYRYYINIDDFSIEKVSSPQPQFDLQADLLFNRAILSIQNASDNVKTWEWTIDGTTYKDTMNIEYLLDKGSCVVTLNAGNVCAMEQKQETLVVDFNLATDFTYTLNDKEVEFSIEQMDAKTVVWDFGDGNTDTGLMPTHTFADYGTYQVSAAIYSDYGIVKLQKEITLKSSSTGIDELSSEILSVFPNPADDFVKIHSDNGGYLEILNSAGSVVKRLVIKGDSEIINISELPKGVYLLKLNENTVKLLKQ